MNDLKELALDDSDLIEVLTERLHTIAGDERVIRKFSSFDMDDEIQQIEFVMRYPVNDFADREYVIELFALGMTIAWLTPKVDSIEYTVRSLGGKEEKNLQNHYKEMQSRLATLTHQFSEKLSSHGYINNSYVRGS